MVSYLGHSRDQVLWSHLLLEENGSLLACVNVEAEDSGIWQQGSICQCLFSGDGCKK